MGTLTCFSLNVFQFEPAVQTATERFDSVKRANISLVIRTAETLAMMNNRQPITASSINYELVRGIFFSLLEFSAKE